MIRRKIIVMIVLMHAVFADAQETGMLGVAFNLGDVYRNTLQMDAMLASRHARWGGLLGLLYTNGKVPDANIKEVDTRYMEDKPDEVSGWGMDMQVRYKVFGMRHDELGIYASLGYRRQQYQV